MHEEQKYVKVYDLINEVMLHYVKLGGNIEINFTGDTWRRRKSAKDGDEASAFVSRLPHANELLREAIKQVSSVVDYHRQEEPQETEA